MKNKKFIVIAGGDLRQVHLANLFSKSESVSVYGFDHDAEFSNKITIINDLTESAKLLNQTDVLILPMPVMENEVYLNAPFSDQKVEAAKVLDAMGPDTVVFAGKITPALKSLLDERKLEYYDYLDREELAILNAVPTAEGTLQIIFEELPVTIYGLKAFIIGSGRISRVLWKDLKALGADVSVSARKHKDLSWIQLDGCHAVHTKNVKDVIGEFDLVVNTVPAKILTEDILTKVKPQTLLIDLASKPGGIDFDVAKKLGLKTIWALSLPGKVAPLSAGEIIHSTISNMLEERAERK